jgi:hypothetical protein
VYVSLRQFPFGSSKTAVIPVKSGAAPPTFTKGFGSEADFARIPGARLINQDDVSSGMSPNYFVSKHRSAKTSSVSISSNKGPGVLRGYSVSRCGRSA